MEEASFFENITECASFTNQGQYADSWLQIANMPSLPTPDYNELYAIGSLLKNIPGNSDLQLANSCTIRMAHFFKIPETIRVNCNRGVNGIDGSMSTAVGFAAENERLTFYITGDLSFFYDMNSLWIRHLSPKMRILLINNGGGAVMYAPLSDEIRKTLPAHVAAGHHVSAKGWVESVGFKYLSASSKGEVDEAISELCSANSDKPILLEVFTTINTDINSIKEYFASLDRRTFTEKLISTVVKKVLPTTIKKEIKKIIKR